METHKVSIIIPAYNAEKTVEKAIHSITGRYQNIEVIVVNDGSTDDTENVVRTISVVDDRIKLYYQENTGVGAAKSRGVFESSGDYIAFCDSDDWYDDNYISEHIKHIEKYNADISMCRMNITSGNDTSDNGDNKDVEVIEGDVIQRYLTFSGISVTLCDKVFKRDCILKPELLNSLRYGEDLFMNYVACKYATRIVKFDTTKYNWYFNTNSLSRGRFNPVRVENDFESWNLMIEYCKKYRPDLEETARLSSELWLCGTYESMVSDHYHNIELERKIAQYIRQDGLKPLQAEKNKRNKMFLKIAIVSFPLARITWYILNSTKSIIKKIMRQ